MIHDKKHSYTNIDTGRSECWRPGRVYLVLGVGVLLLLFVLTAGAWMEGFPKQTTTQQPPSKLTTTAKENKCDTVDWYEACSRLEGASARRRRRLEMEPELYSDFEEFLLDSDDPSVTYDDNCLRVYRLDLFGKTTFPYHANHLLRSGGNQTMALFIQHGAMRNADAYFCSFRTLMLEQNYRPFSDILIIAADFNYKNDPGVLPTDAFWNATKPWGDWRVGAESDPECCNNGFGGHGGSTISSFAVLDHMLNILADTQLYPHLDKIAYVGHSAGGQMVQRYAIMSELATKYDEASGEGGLDLEFVVANPSSYTYLDERRWRYNCGSCRCNSDNCTCDQDCTELSGLGVPKKHSHKDFPCFDHRYNQWPYGMGAFSDRKHEIPYVMEAADGAMARYQRRDVVYMVGQNDTCTDTVFPTCNADCWKKDDYLPHEWPCFRNHMDTRCPALLEGPFRNSRGRHYMQYLQDIYGQPTHNFHIIEGCGHNASCMFGSNVGLRELFD